MVLELSLCSHVFLPDESESVANANFPTVLTSESIQISDLTISPPGPLINTDHFIISFNSHHTLMPSIKNKKVRYSYLDGLCSDLLDADFGISFQSSDIEFVKLYIYEAMHMYIPKVKVKSYHSQKRFIRILDTILTVFALYAENLNSIPQSVYKFIRNGSQVENVIC